MALPAGVTTATVTVGVPVTFSGGPVRSTITITPSAFLVHTATGTPLVNLIEETSTSDGVAAQFTLPHTDQTGFQDENGNAYQNWYYTATIQYQTNKLTRPPFTKVFQLAVGQTTVDLDLLPSGAPAMPYTAPVATVTSVNGSTGAVSVTPLTDSGVAAFVQGAGPTATALNATYGEQSLRRQTVSYLGDSLSIPSSVVLGTDPLWAEVAHSLLGHRYTHGYQGGIGGQTSAQILARVPDVVAAAPKGSIVIVHAGVNSIHADVTAATVITELTQIIDGLRAAGIVPVLLTLVPSTYQTGARITEAGKVNAWIKALPTAMGVHSIDWRAAVIDWAVTDPRWVAALTADGTHPNEKGQVVLGRSIAAGLAPLITGPSPLAAGPGAGSGVVSANPGMNGSGGTNTSTAITGTVPASWTLRGTGTGTSVVETRTDEIGGNWWTLDLTAASGTELFIQNTAVGVDWNVGDTVTAEVELLLPVAPSNLRTLVLRVDFWNAIGSVTYGALAMPPATVLSLPAGTPREPLVIRTKPTVVPAGTARLQFVLTINEAAAPLALKAKIGRASIRRNIP